MARTWVWGITAAGWIIGTAFWGFWPRHEQSFDGLLECHVPWLAAFASLGLAVFGSWWIADLRDHPRFPLVLAGTAVLWVLLALGWPLILGNACYS